MATKEENKTEENKTETVKPITEPKKKAAEALTSADIRRAYRDGYNQATFEVLEQVSPIDYRNILFFIVFLLILIYFQLRWRY